MSTSSQSRRIARAAQLASAALALWMSAGGALAATATWPIDTSKSEVVVHVFRAGALSPSLHNHAFVPEHWSGNLAFDPQAPERSSVEVSLDAASLRDQEPELSAKDRATVEQQVHSPRILDTQRYPDIRFTADRLEDLHRLDAQHIQGVLIGSLELHGQKQPLRIPIEATWGSQGLDATGNVSFLQSEFGISPYKKFLGAIAVQDRVRVDLKIHANPLAAR